MRRKPSSPLSHVDEAGRVRMVDVSDKPETERVAIATGEVRMNVAARRAIATRAVKKGDPLQTARVAGIMAAKRTSDLIPLCHPLPLTRVEVDLQPMSYGYRIAATVATVGRTGVEMEALVAVSVAALTLYDMLKAVDHGITITRVQLAMKRGGRSGVYGALMTRTDVPNLPETIAQLVFFTSGRYPRAELIGRCAESGVTWTSGRELLERVRDISLGLSTLGVRSGDRVALLSESRPEWLFTDLAIVSGGAVTTPLYPSLTADQIATLLEDSQSSVVVVSTETQLAKVLQVAPGLRSLRAIVTMDASAPPVKTESLPVHTLAEVAAAGHNQILAGWGVAKAFQDAARSIRPSDLATLIYTSGTTAAPKGVLLTHGNLAANIAGCCGALDLQQEDVALSFLPLSHAFERTVNYVYLATGVSIVFAESIDTLARDLLLARPTVMTGVPRVFEKLQARILSKGRSRGLVARTAFDWGIGVAARRAVRRAANVSSSPVHRAKVALASRLVFRKVHEGLGGRLRYAVSGGAALRPDVGQFFDGLGLPILEGYGLTETSPVISVMRLDAIRFGTVGPPLPNVEVRIASDGEVLARGPSVMDGYYQRPEETAAVLVDGWFHTGDVGSLDAEGYLRITDRKKDLLVTSGGKKIAPQPIETALKARDVIDEAMVVAERRHFPAALLVPDISRLCAQIGCPSPDTEQATAVFLARADVLAAVQAAVDEVNVGLAQFERIKRFALTPRAFTVEAGELTPTLKVRRRFVEQKYADVIEEIYRAG